MVYKITSKWMGYGVALAFLVWIGREVVCFRGFEQLGSYISFLGSLFLFIPPYRQLTKNRNFSLALQYKSNDPELEKLNKKVEQRRKQEILAYSQEDFVFALLGLVLSIVGVSLTVYMSLPPVP